MYKILTHHEYTVHVQNTHKHVPCINVQYTQYSQFIFNVSLSSLYNSEKNDKK